MNMTPPKLPLLCCALLAFAAPTRAQSTFYWSPGAGTGGSGTWDLSTASWATNASGTGTKSNYTAATITGTTTSGSPTVTVASTTGVATRQMVYGTGIATAATVTNLVADTSIGLSSNATASGNANLTFSRAGDALVFGGTAGTVTLSTPLSIGTGSLRFTTSDYIISGDTNNAIYFGGTPNATYGSAYVTNGVSASISGLKPILAFDRFEVCGNGTLTLTSSTFGGLKVGGTGQSYSNTVVIGTGINLSNGYLRVNNTSKAQLMGNSLAVGDFKSDATNFFGSVIENGGAADATLTAFGTASIGDAYYGILQDGSGGGILSLVINKDYQTSPATNRWVILGGTNANTYSGATHIANGKLVLAKADGVNAIAGQITIGDGAGTTTGDFLALGANNQIADTSVISMSNGASTTHVAAFDLGGYSETIGGVASLDTGANSFIRNNGAADSTLTVNDAFNREFKGAIIDGTNTGKMIIVKSGAGTWTLSGTNTYTGGTTISAGAIKLGASDRLADTGAVTVSGGTFDLGAFSETVGAITLSSGTITNGTLTGSSYAVHSGAVGAVLAGSGALTKSGAGTVTLTATNTYNGATTVEAGKLVVNGAIANSAVTVQSGAVLGGSGAVGALTVGSGATLAPGNSAGTLTINGNNAWQNGGSYDWEIFDLNGPAGTGWDLAAATGTLDLNGLTGAQNFNINVLSLGNDNSTPGALTGFNNAASYQWKIASFTGGISGSFLTNRFTVNLAGFTNYNSIGGGLFSLALGEGDTALFLNYEGGGAPIPEPGTWAAAALLACCAFLLRRRRREA